jgi:hypothetical protein
MTFFIADKREPTGQNATVGISREQLPGAPQALNATIEDNPQGTSRAPAETGRLFLAAFNAMRQQPRRQT